MPGNDRLSPQGIDGVWPAAFLKSPSSEIRDLRPLLRFFGDPHARQVLWAFTQKWPHLGPGLLAAELPRHLLWGLEAPRLGLTRATIDRVITTGRHLGMLDSELRGNRDGSDTVRMACAESLRIIAAAKGMKGEEEVLEVYAMAGVLDVAMRLLHGPATRAELSRACGVDRYLAVFSQRYLAPAGVPLRIPSGRPTSWRAPGVGG